ncbi:MAG: response regulator transcription factor [Lentimicrobium sp.]|jgi:two-component system alkaline phosphatase synthesis response regulator PhoP|nr:response regulator transcription factor [Lentimicrobium sp.]MDD2527832.1 response regulator transcription factor [Lentimicrobiaceae bacterium]MDD4598121.1 response regulator transcription factor [Lentimicrobiaceae bacterium]MDY0026545.1 response regulator transcription factor [Lentimicrobium sp.]HAH58344.1 DNA-binding response regulator [Bacteroidales bacterium]
MENPEYSILLIDDEADVLEFLSYNLSKAGYRVLKAHDGAEGLKLARKHRPHLIILDVMMPQMDGIETCKAIRKIDALKNTILVFLTARGEDYSQIAGFEAGADDYIAKPVKPRVLTSRIQALLRRYVESLAITYNDDLIIDREKYTVNKSGREFILPRKEFELLMLLSSRPNKVFTREEIFSIVWGDDVIVGDRTIDVHVRKIREKIGIDHIKTIKGVGYSYKATHV